MITGGNGFIIKDCAYVYCPYGHWIGISINWLNMDQGWYLKLWRIKKIKYFKIWTIPRSIKQLEPHEGYDQQLFMWVIVKLKKKGYLGEARLNETNSLFPSFIISSSTLKIHFKSF